jgi:hypothetical protein
LPDSFSGDEPQMLVGHDFSFPERARLTPQH